MKTTRTVRRQADRFEQDDDGLSLRQQVRECCDEIDRLRKLIGCVAADWLAWGPVDDGTPQGERLEKSLSALVQERCHRRTG